MEVVVVEKMKQNSSSTLGALSAPTTWPGANARLLGLGVGLPIAPWIVWHSLAPPNLKGLH